MMFKAGFEPNVYDIVFANQWLLPLNKLTFMVMKLAYALKGAYNA